MDPNILEREMPAAKFGALAPDLREHLVKMHLDQNFGNGLEWYPRTGPKGGMPNKTCEMLVHLDFLRSKYSKTPEEISVMLNCDVMYILEMGAAADILRRAGTDPQQIFKQPTQGT